jgi:hypothetical protein
MVRVKKLSVKGTGKKVHTRSQGSKGLAGQMSAESDWAEGQKIDRRTAFTKGLQIVGGKRLRVVKQVDGTIDGLALWSNSKIVHKAGKPQKIAFFQIAARVKGMKVANAFRSRALARNPHQPPRYEFIEQSKNDIIVYDNLLSPAMLINVNLQGKGNNNCEIGNAAARAGRGSRVWVRSTKSIGRSGHLYNWYGKGSNHYIKIADEQLYAANSHKRHWHGHLSAIRSGKNKGGKLWEQFEEAGGGEVKVEQREEPAGLKSKRARAEEITAKRRAACVARNKSSL